LVKIMCEKDLLVSYLYDDLGDADRARFETHLRDCADCRGELNELRGVRADLISWSPPDADFGFRVVREPKVVAMKPRGAQWGAWWTPAVGLAAAAVLVLAAASAIAHVEIRRGPDGLTVRTGWNTAAAATLASNAPADAGAANRQTVGVSSPEPRSSAAADAATLARIEARLRALETAPHDSGVRAASTLSARMSDVEVIHRVRDMLTVSEAKQQGELALRVAQLIRDFDTQRTADLQRIQQRFARVDNTVAAETAAHSEMANILLTSAKQK
jgi:Putative zinc-finger